MRSGYLKRVLLLTEKTIATATTTSDALLFFFLSLLQSTCTFFDAFFLFCVLGCFIQACSLHFILYANENPEHHEDVKPT